MGCTTSKSIGLLMDGSSTNPSSMGGDLGSADPESNNNNKNKDNTHDVSTTLESIVLSDNHDNITPPTTMKTMTTVAANITMNANKSELKKNNNNSNSNKKMNATNKKSALRRNHELDEMIVSAIKTCDFDQFKRILQDEKHQQKQLDIVHDRFTERYLLLIHLVVGLEFNNALHHQFQRRYPMARAEMIQFLIDNGANVDELDEEGRTPLLLECRREKNTQVISCLLQNGANVNATNQEGYSCLWIAYCGKSSISFGSAMARRSTEVVKLLLKHGADPNHDPNLLVTALEDDAVDIVSLLLFHGADPNNDSNYDGRLALFSAVCGRSDPVQCTRLLLQYGANVHSTAGPNQSTPLHDACGSADVIDMLLAANANVYALDDLGRTPLHVAVAGYDTVKARALMKHDYHPVLIRDMEGRSPLHMLAQMTYEERRFLKELPNPPIHDNDQDDNNDDNAPFSFSDFQLDSIVEYGTRRLVMAKTLVECYDCQNKDQLHQQKKSKKKRPIPPSCLFVRNVNNHTPYEFICQAVVAILAEISPGINVHSMDDVLWNQFLCGRRRRCDFQNAADAATYEILHPVMTYLGSYSRQPITVAEHFDENEDMTETSLTATTTMPNTASLSGCSNNNNNNSRSVAVRRNPLLTPYQIALAEETFFLLEQKVFPQIAYGIMGYLSLSDIIVIVDDDEKSGRS